jgi:hypothetical protein
MKGDPLSEPGRFAPLDPDHPLVTAERECVVCHKSFVAGDRVALIDSGEPAEGLTVEADPAHEGCVEW